MIENVITDKLVKKILQFSFLSAAAMSLVFTNGCSDQRGIANTFAKLKNDELIAKKKQLAQEKLETRNCPDISNLKKNIQDMDKNLYTVNRMRLIDSILARYGKAICPDLETFLRDHYANTDLEDFLNKRLVQFNRLSGSDIIAIVKDDPDVPFPGNLIWPQVAPGDLRVKWVSDGMVEISGTIEDGPNGPSLTITTTIPTKSLKFPKNPTKEEMAAAVGDGLVIFKKSNEKKVVGITDPKKTSNNAIFDMVKGLMKKADIVAAEVKERVGVPHPENFKSDEASSIDAAGNNHAPGSTVSVLRAHTSNQGPDVWITDIPLTEKDRTSLSLNTMDPAQQNETVKKAAIEPFKNEHTDLPGYFWRLFTKCGAVAYTVKQLTESDDAANRNTVNFRFSIVTMDIKDVAPKDIVSDDGKLKVQVGYRPVDQAKFDRLQSKASVTFHMAFSSALWLKSQTSWVLDNLVKKELADPKASLDSLRAYAFYSYLKETKKISQEAVCDDLSH